MILRQILATILVLLFAAQFASPEGSKPPTTVDLIVNRPGGWAGALVSLDIYVNEHKIGEVTNGARVACTFTPALDGKNTLRFSGASPVWRSLLSKSKTVPFFALPGSSLEVKVSFSAMKSQDECVGVEFLPEKPQLVSVVVNSKLKSEVLKELPPVQVPFGTSHEYSRSITVSHTVETTDHWLVEGQAQGGIWNVLRVGIRAMVEKLTRETYQSSSTYTPKVILQGQDRGGSTYRVFWVQYYRTGTCTYRTTHGLKTAPFQIADDCDLKVERFGRR